MLICGQLLGEHHLQAEMSTGTALSDTELLALCTSLGDGPMPAVAA
jgi:hypothetical protein